MTLYENQDGSSAAKVYWRGLGRGVAAVSLMTAAAYGTAFAVGAAAKRLGWSEGTNMTLNSHVASHNLAK